MLFILDLPGQVIEVKILLHHSKPVITLPKNSINKRVQIDTI